MREAGGPDREECRGSEADRPCAGPAEVGAGGSATVQSWQPQREPWIWREPAIKAEPREQGRGSQTRSNQRKQEAQSRSEALAGSRFWDGHWLRADQRPAQSPGPTPPFPSFQTWLGQTLQHTLQGPRQRNRSEGELGAQVRHARSNNSDGSDDSKPSCNAYYVPGSVLQGPWF